MRRHYSSKKVLPSKAPENAFPVAPSKAKSVSKWGELILYISVSLSLYSCPNSLAQTQNKGIICKACSRVTLGEKRMRKSFVFYCEVLSGVMSFVLFTLTHERARCKDRNPTLKSLRASEWVSGDIAVHQEFSYLAPGLRWRAELESRAMLMRHTPLAIWSISWN
jgi:hypothetical protein